MFSKLSFLYKYRRHLAILLLIALVLGAFVGWSLWIYKTGVNQGKLAKQAEHDAFVKQTLQAQITGTQQLLSQYKAKQEQHAHIANRYVQQIQAQQQTIDNLTESFNEYINSNSNTCQLDANGVRLINKIINAANAQH